MTDAPETPEAKRKRFSQWFTPEYVAQAMWDRAKIHDHLYVLEPSAGTGSLILPVDDDVLVTACEIDPELVESHLLQMHPPLHRVIECDFLTFDFLELYPNHHDPTLPIFGTCLMNPPFENGQDLACVLKAFSLCHVLIACVRVQFMHRVAPWRGLWSRPDVNLTWRGDCVPRPRFSGTKETPMDEYVCFEICHGPQQPNIEYTRIVNPKLLVTL